MTAADVLPLPRSVRTGSDVPHSVAAETERPTRTEWVFPSWPIEYSTVDAWPTAGPSVPGLSAERLMPLGPTGANTPGAVEWFHPFTGNGEHAKEAVAPAPWPTTDRDGENGTRIARGPARHTTGYVTAFRGNLWDGIRDQEESERKEAVTESGDPGWNLLSRILEGLRAL